MTNEIIVVKQLPIIEQQLLAIKTEIELKVAAAIEMECTEDTYKEIKIIRAGLNKDFNELEDKRKEVKKKILSPYEKFEAIYKSCVTEIFKPADRELAKKIAFIEEGLKAQKRMEATAYFDEYLISKNIDFLTFEDMGLNITLNTSKKSLKDKIKANIDKVSDDLAMIDTQEHKAEILVEYKRSLNVSQAIMTVTSRMKAIDEERKRAESAKASREEKQAAAQRIDEIVEEQQILTAPEEIPALATANTFTPLPLAEPEKLYKLAFEALGTLEQLKQLKYFTQENLGITLTKIKNYEV